MYTVVIITAIIVIFFYLYVSIRNKKIKTKRLELEAKKRAVETQKTIAFINQRLERIKTANSAFLSLIKIENGYFNNNKLIDWTSSNKKLFKEITENRNINISLPNDLDNIVKFFTDTYSNSSSIRDQYNKKFIEHELSVYSNFFNNIENRKLDIQQCTSIITDEDNSLVIAGAGSGKTTTIIGKVNYLIDRYKTDTDKILLISFTDKSAKTISRRININNIEAKTFHKFSLDLIKETEGAKPSTFDQNQFTLLVKKLFIETISSTNWLEKTVDYFIDFLKQPKSQFDFSDHGEYIQYLKDKKFQTYKGNRITYAMEVVKSIEECKIANFLLFNNIDYKYEHPYEHTTNDIEYRQYRPDFTIFQNDQKIYLEHFAVARNGDVPQFFAKNNESIEAAKERYWSKINWARDTHKENNTHLIESYSYEMQENTLFDNLKSNLLSAGIILIPKSKREIWDIIQKSAPNELDDFISLLCTFITLLKSNNYSFSDIREKNKILENAPQRSRNSAFLDIAEQIFIKYENHLKENKEIDFSDMINRASYYIISGKYKKSYDYIIIDEFQDLSIGRYKLLSALRLNNPNTKIFAVGDDWQSIYRFTGSDITLFKDFEQYFGYTKRSKIETTYRFHEPLISLSSNFIQKNPNQTPKNLISTSKTSSTTYQILYHLDTIQGDSGLINQTLYNLILNDSDLPNKEILILGRYSFDLDRLAKNNNSFAINRNTGEIKYSTRINNNIITIPLRFLTIHKAKGLEADIVFIINCESGKYGLPSEQSDDEVLNLLLSKSDQYENGEERRLFYVAMTRAKEKLFLITNPNNKSKFIIELEDQQVNDHSNKCPLCKKGEIILKREGTAKNGNTYKFYTCTNFLYGCEYNSTEWNNFN